MRGGANVSSLQLITIANADPKTIRIIATGIIAFLWKLEKKLGFIIKIFKG